MKNKVSSFKLMFWPWERKNKTNIIIFYVLLFISIILFLFACWYWYLSYANYSKMNSNADRLWKLSTFKWDNFKDDVYDFSSWWDIINQIDLLSKEKTDLNSKFKKLQSSYFYLMENIYLPSQNIWKDPYTNDIDYSIVWQKFLNQNPYIDTNLLDYWSWYFKDMWPNLDSNTVTDIKIQWVQYFTEPDKREYFRIPIKVSFSSTTRQSFLMLINKLSLTSSKRNISLINEFVYNIWEIVKQTKNDEIQKIKLDYIIKLVNDLSKIIWTNNELDSDDDGDVVLNNETDLNTNLSWNNDNTERWQMLSRLNEVRIKALSWFVTELINSQLFDEETTWRIKNWSEVYFKEDPIKSATANSDYEKTKERIKKILINEIKKTEDQIRLNVENQKKQDSLSLWTWESFTGNAIGSGLDFEIKHDKQIKMKIRIDNIEDENIKELTNFVNNELMSNPKFSESKFKLWEMWELLRLIADNDSLIWMDIYNWVKKWNNSRLLDNDVFIKWIVSSANCPVKNYNIDEECYYIFREKYSSISELAYNMWNSKTRDKMDVFKRFLTNLTPILSIESFSFKKNSNIADVEDSWKYFWDIEIFVYWRTIDDKEYVDIENKLWQECWEKPTPQADSKKLDITIALNKIQEDMLSLSSDSETNSDEYNKLSEIKESIEWYGKTLVDASNYDKIIKLFEIYRILTENRIWWCSVK